VRSGSCRSPDAGPETWHDLHMGLLGRKADKPGTGRADQHDLEHALAAIAAFWAWWSTVHEQIGSEAAEGGPSPERSAEITAHVEAIGKGLEWELSRQPDTAAHQLVVTAGGVAELRSLAQRWAQAAPVHPGWSYLPARPASPAAGFTLVVDGGEYPGNTEIAAGRPAPPSSAHRPPGLRRRSTSRPRPDRHLTLNGCRQTTWRAGSAVEIAMTWRWTASPPPVPAVVAGLGDIQNRAGRCCPAVRQPDCRSS
jgi:hypothetical protein